MIVKGFFEILSFERILELRMQVILFVDILIAMTNHLILITFLTVSEIPTQRNSETSLEIKSA